MEIWGRMEIIVGISSRILNCCDVSINCDKSCLMYLVTCSSMSGKLCCINVPVRFCMCFCSKQNSVTYWIWNSLICCGSNTAGEGKISFYTLKFRTVCDPHPWGKCNETTGRLLSIGL